jgi:hypothetical protein
MESFLKTEHAPDSSFEAALKSALDAWSVGHMALQTGDAKELPERTAVTKYRREQLANTGIEAGILERDSSRGIRYRALLDKELRALIHD